jgi:hypothetical protein
MEQIILKKMVATRAQSSAESIIKASLKYGMRDIHSRVVGARGTFILNPNDIKTISNFTTNI